MSERIPTCDECCRPVDSFQWHPKHGGRLCGECMDEFIASLPPDPLAFHLTQDPIVGTVAPCLGGGGTPTWA